jgi:hypothetical protein
MAIADFFIWNLVLGGWVGSARVATSFDSRVPNLEAFHDRMMAAPTLLTDRQRTASRFRKIAMAAWGCTFPDRNIPMDNLATLVVFITFLAPTVLGIALQALDRAPAPWRAA